MTEVIHPGRYLQQELLHRGRTQKDFAYLIGKKVSEVNELIKGKRNITVQWDMLLSTLFADPEKKWIHLQIEYDYQKGRELFQQEKQQEILERKQHMDNAGNSIHQEKELSIPEEKTSLPEEEVSEEETPPLPEAIIQSEKIPSPEEPISLEETNPTPPDNKEPHQNDIPSDAVLPLEKKEVGIEAEDNPIPTKDLSKEHKIFRDF